MTQLVGYWHCSECMNFIKKGHEYTHEKCNGKLEDDK